MENAIFLTYKPNNIFEKTPFETLYLNDDIKNRDIVNIVESYPSDKNKFNCECKSIMLSQISNIYYSILNESYGINDHIVTNQYIIKSCCLNLSQLIDKLNSLFKLITFTIDKEQKYSNYDGIIHIKV